MLESFIGTCDAAGLRTLRPEDERDVTSRLDGEEGRVSFWAILDSAALPCIYRELTLDHRATALKLLVQMAKTLGPVHR
jgi:hypothetical protein